ncbi:hypothetical protein [Endozoicomonas euniceicola]|uniref:Transposase IS204/IS1001/IS1096/IS1165 zinc-finger domain-containing protein n=1 Tax=Endozoicomonas euniceicola TaxID=1234143 RepID=A0ABY6GT07_9GAMM|nr:hypothetical protein [Endozoicomonas euniceicola]UYM15895.1 hypothetical protein NX720_24260 [Endozoicomonas euniceicola]
MLIKTILNKVHKLKSFVYQDVKPGVYQGSEVFNVTVVPRKNSHAVCSGCLKPAPGYDSLAERRFEFVPLWGIRVFLLYTMRRVQCKTCGVKVEQVPWGDGKKELTKVYMQFLASWARKLSWKEVACTFNTSWEKVFHAVEYVVEWGKAHRSLDNIKAIGVDEVAYQIGHKYLTVVLRILVKMNGDSGKREHLRFPKHCPPLFLA